MKRSSCVSALLVGLSLVTTTSVALAADPQQEQAPVAKTNNGKPVQVAQAKVDKSRPQVRAVQTNDPAPEEGGTTTTPAPATEAPGVGQAPTETPSPAITIGTASPAPGTDTPSDGQAAIKAPPKRRPFAGTQIYTTTSMTTATIFKNQQQDYNPTVESTLWLLPRYAISDSFQLRGRIVFSYEYTDSDTTTRKNEPRASDTTLQLFYRKIPEIPGGIKPMVAANVGLPTSPESRARTMIFTPGLTLQLSKAFEHVLGGEIDLLASSTYTHPIYQNTTAELRTQPGYGFQCMGGTSCQDQLGGIFNPSDTLSYIFLISGTWGKWSPALYYFGGSQWAYKGKDVVHEETGRTITSPAGFNPTSVRQTSYFSAWVDYEANTWLTAEVGYWLSRSVLAGDGQRGSMFFDPYQDMRVYVGANFNIDNIMKQIEGAPAEAGIVRAQNTRTRKSMWSF